MLWSCATVSFQALLNKWCQLLNSLPACVVCLFLACLPLYFFSVPVRNWRRLTRHDDTYRLAKTLHTYPREKKAKSRLSERSFLQVQRSGLRGQDAQAMLAQSLGSSLVRGLEALVQGFFGEEAPTYWFLVGNEGRSYPVLFLVYIYIYIQRGKREGDVRYLIPSFPT